MKKFIEHCENVAYYAVKIMGYKLNLFASGLLHDCGKIKIPTPILHKKGPLTDYEFKIIKRHPVEGAKILKKIGFCDEIIEAVMHHHERWDGNGYPYGLKGKNIPLYSRVLAILVKSWTPGIPKPGWPTATRTATAR